MKRIFDFIISKKEILKKIFPIKFLRYCKQMVLAGLNGKYKPKPINNTVFGNMKKGVNLIGDIQMEIGLGQSMRLLANALDLSKLDFGVFNLQLAEGVRRNDHSWDHKISQDTPHGINLFHINPQELGAAYFNMNHNVWKDRYNIGFWLWELEEFPKEYQQNFKYVDEIWTPSEFTSNCFRKITDKPVRTIPYYVTAETEARFNRAYFDLPEDKFLFLIMFDLNSTMLRKNPMGAIQAFKDAFDRDDQSVGLVIKVNNPTQECMDTLSSLLENYNNIHYITKIMDKPEVNGLIGCVDTFVSLHRAEGFGLVMAEAMLLKTACIATNWSSNTEFMNSDVACMVPYNLVHFKKGEGSYTNGGTWADADVAETIKYMKLLKENQDVYNQMVDRAYDYINTVLGKDKIVSLLEKRVAEIYEMLGVEI